jgi:hypothetical protein
MAHGVAQVSQNTHYNRHREQPSSENVAEGKCGGGFCFWTAKREVSPKFSCLANIDSLGFKLNSELE